MARRGSSQPGVFSRPSPYDAIAGQMMAAGTWRPASASVSYNPNYWNSVIGQRELERERESNQQAEIDKNLKSFQAQFDTEQEMRGAPLTSAGAQEDVEQFVSQAGGGPNAEYIANPFAQEREERIQQASGQLGQFNADMGEFQEARSAYDQADYTKAAKEYAALATSLNNGATKRQISRAQQMFQKRYPWFDATVRPMSKEQAQSLMKDIEKETTQKQLDKVTQQYGVASIPLDYDENGRLRTIPGYAEAMSAVTKSQNERARLLTESRYQKKVAFEAELQMAQDRFGKPPEEFEADAGAIDQWRQSKAKAEFEIFQKYYGSQDLAPTQAPGRAQTPTSPFLAAPQPVQTPAPMAPVEISSQEDYKKWVQQANGRYATAFWNGQKIEINPNGPR